MKIKKVGVRHYDVVVMSGSGENNGVPEMNGTSRKEHGGKRAKSGAQPAMDSPVARMVLGAAASVDARACYYCKMDQEGELHTVFAAERPYDGQPPGHIESPPEFNADTLSGMKMPDYMMALPVHKKEGREPEGYVVLTRPSNRKENPYGKRAKFSETEETVAKFIVGNNAPFVLDDSRRPDFDEQEKYTSKLARLTRRLLQEHSPTHHRHVGKVTELTWDFATELAHVTDVAADSDDITRPMKIGMKNLKRFGKIALLHDADKANIDCNQVLEFDGPLDVPEKWNRMRAHTVNVGTLLNVPVLDGSPYAHIASAHHMKPNGEGYPYTADDGMHEAFEVQLLQICDIFEAMTGPRPYQHRPKNAAAKLALLYAYALQEEVNPWLLRQFLQSQTLESYVAKNETIDAGPFKYEGKPNNDTSRILSTLDGCDFNTVRTRILEDETLKRKAGQYKEKMTYMLFEPNDSPHALQDIPRVVLNTTEQVEQSRAAEVVQQH